MVETCCPINQIATKRSSLECSSFDDEASTPMCGVTLSQRTYRGLIRDIHKDGIPYKAFLDSITNKVMATSPMVQDVVWQICGSKDFEIICPSGKSKRSSNLEDNDIIRPRQQFYLPGAEIPSVKKPAKVIRSVK